MTRARPWLPWLLGALAVVVAAGVFLATHDRVERRFPLPPRGEAGYNPLYALKLALRAAGQAVESRQRLQLDTLALGPRDTVLVYSDPRTLTAAELEALFAFAARGGHLVLRLPPWEPRTASPGEGLLARLPLQPALAAPACARPGAGLQDGDVFCAAPRFQLRDGAAPVMAWPAGKDDGGYAFARFAHGEGSIDLLSDLDFLAGNSLRASSHLVLARQLLAPRWGAGTFHLIYAADMPPLWRWLIANGAMALLPLLPALLGWLWMRMQRFGPLLPAPMPARRSLLEHVQASGEHLARYGQLALLHRAVRDAVLARLRRRDPLAAALEGDAQAALLAPRVGLRPAEVRALLDTRPPLDATEFRTRIARLLALRTRL